MKSRNTTSNNQKTSQARKKYSLAGVGPCHSQEGAVVLTGTKILTPSQVILGSAGVSGNDFWGFGNGKGIEKTHSRNSGTGREWKKIHSRKSGPGRESRKSIPEIREREGNEKIHSQSSGKGIRGLHSWEWPGTGVPAHPCLASFFLLTIRIRSALSIGINKEFLFSVWIWKKITGSNQCQIFRVTEKASLTQFETLVYKFVWKWEIRVWRKFGKLLVCNQSHSLSCCQQWFQIKRLIYK